MRIDGNSSLQNASFRQIQSRPANGPAFIPELDTQSVSTNASMGIEASAGIETLLALQAFEDPVYAKRKAMRRGTALLDTLDGIKSDFLAGKVSEGRLNQLMSLIGQARERTAPGLDSLLDDIELRAHVELAKLGRFALA